MCFAPQSRTLFEHLNFQKCSEANVLCTFDFGMCFAPQRRALFRHLNFQKCSEPVSFSHFWLPNVLRATAACTFSTSETSKVLWTWGAFSFFTCKCASRHNGVQLFISHLTTWLRTRRFSEPTFRPSGATNRWQNTVFRHLHLLSSHSFSSLIFSLRLFSSLTLPTSAFPSVHIVGSLTSKLPAIICMCICYIIHKKEIFMHPGFYWYLLASKKGIHSDEHCACLDNLFCSSSAVQLSKILAMSG